MKKLLLAASLLALTASVQAQTGEEVFNKACAVCHAAGVAGAPVAHDAAAWEPRLAKGIDTLVGSVTNGLNAMPPGGMCTDCTPDDYKAAITFMSKAK